MSSEKRKELPVAHRSIRHFLGILSSALDKLTEDSTKYCIIESYCISNDIEFPKDLSRLHEILVDKGHMSEKQVDVLKKRMRGEDNIYMLKVYMRTNCYSMFQPQRSYPILVSLIELLNSVPVDQYSESLNAMFKAAEQGYLDPLFFIGCSEFIVKVINTKNQELLTLLQEKISSGFKEPAIFNEHYEYAKRFYEKDPSLMVMMEWINEHCFKEEEQLELSPAKRLA